jgi:hypothetical protein
MDNAVDALVRARKLRGDEPNSVRCYVGLCVIDGSLKNPSPSIEMRRWRDCDADDEEIGDELWRCCVVLCAAVGLLVLHKSRLLPAWYTGAEVIVFVC